MNNKRTLLYYNNNHNCVSLPKNEECDYLRIYNYLSEYLTELEKQLVLENLGITEKIDLLYKLLNNKLNLYATLKFLDDNYVKKIDLYYPEEEDDDDGFEPISFISGDGNGSGNGYGSWNVDDFLSLTSTNPVQNRIITAALNQKLDISSLDNYVTSNDLSNYLSQYQRYLVAGFGINIDRSTNTISTTLDLNPFIFVDTLPTTGDPNKIYLTPDKTSPGYYMLYHYDPNKRKWIELGRISIQSTLTGGGISLEEADARYLKKGELPSSFTTTIINNVKQLLGNYVKKSEVYTPDLWGDDSASGQINNNDDNGSGGTIIDWGEGGNYVNITVDTALNSKSLNPVTNRAIKIAIDAKQDKLTNLNAGTGIRIDEDGVINCTFDTSVYKFVSMLPVGGGDPSKVYLLKRDGTIYKQYIYEENSTGGGSWKYIGDIDLGIDITGYLSKQEAALSYMTRLELATTYLTKSEFSEYFALMLSGGGSIDGSLFATKEYVQNLISNIDSDALDALSQFSQSNYLDLMTAIAGKADSENVYTKSQADTTFLRKGDYIYRTDFSSSIATLTNKIDNFVIDETLSGISEHAVQNKAIYRELQKYITESLANETFATKRELLSVSITLKTINGQSLLGTGNIQITVPADGTISENSLTAVSGRTVYQYINNNQLTAGTGINIENGVISVTLDAINPFIITDTKPAEGEANKLYLIKEQSGYRQWTYENNAWVDKGLLDLSVDLTNYVTNNDVTNLRTWINNNFVRKEDVYTPDLEDVASQGISIGSSHSSSGSSGSSGSILPPSSNSSSGGTAYFTTELPDGVKTNVAVGNITVNTDISTLKGLSFSEIMTKMLFKESYNNPYYTHFISIDINRTIAKVGEVMETPTVVTSWNSNILPSLTITSSISVRKNNSTSTTFYPGSIYSDPGTYVFVLDYSYPQGHYDLVSNFGNTREYTVPAYTGALTKTVKVTYPWFINNVELTTLVPIGDNYTEEIFLNASPKISIPGINSTCNILADLGLGYMDTEWTRSTEVRNGIVYSVWNKPGAYLQDVKHKITFNIYL